MMKKLGGKSGASMMKALMGGGMGGMGGGMPGGMRAAPEELRVVACRLRVRGGFREICRAARAVCPASGGLPGLVASLPAEK